MTSAAYGVGRDSVAEATAECCQARFFLKREANREACRGKIRSMARTVREGRSRFLAWPEASASRNRFSVRNR
ncbi:MAG: hypothetical protein DRJ61_19100 [Acidobacteria bacterium]|nr:MAG: hypothetical protein DRJ61_19100 [Acidobacteriota bacterium]